MKTLQIVIHCLPREIDQLERVCNSLRESSYFIEGDLQIVLDVSLNLNSHFTNWENSKIPSSFFEQKFNTIKKLHSDWAETLFTIEKTDRCLGINDKRRNSIRDGRGYDFLMYLDLDVFFPNFAFNTLSQLISQLNGGYHIISAETVKLWDNSWDNLVNEKYKEENNEFFKIVDPYQVNSLAVESLYDQKFGYREISPIKFGGGWFNIFSKELLVLISIPKSLGSYGLDDTFIMMAAQIMVDKGYEVKQHILEGIVVIENNKYSLYDYNPYKDFIDDLSFTDKGREFKKKEKEQSHLNFNVELQNFANLI